MDGDAVRERAGELPRQPGVYQFQDGETVVYVGKAVDIRDRVRSYADPRSRRIRRMVKRADSIDYSVTDTETQALLLEANLIKRFQPRYNVRLKDDKSYPLVQLTDHEFPRIEITRDPDPEARARRDGGGTGASGSGPTVSGPRVFGPFTRKTQVEVVVKALRETYGVRGCSDHKYSNRDRPCLDYDIGLCTAPCTDEIDRESYVADVESVVRFFEGETGVLADPLRRQMEEAAAGQEFERAANLRDKLDAVEGFHGGAGEAVADQSDERAVDVLGVALEGDSATVARLHSESGQLVDRERHAVTIPESDADDADTRASAVLSAFVTQYYTERDLPDALLFSDRPDDEEVLDWLESEGVSARVPGAGREATLVDLALKNARRGASESDALAALRDALNLDRVPRRIEGFDVSHAQGKHAVGSDVAFEDGSADKSGYRRKKLTDENDDYANMYDLVRWRADRAVEDRDDRPDPDLLLIDGGEGQLNAARDALADAGWDVPAVALAKDEELVVTPDGTFDWPSDADHLHVLQRVRDEAHRFAVQYHQTLRDDVSTELDNVPGIGPATRRSLLRRFGSVEGIRDASRAELRAVEGVGEKTAETIETRL
ncbi:excinuclease ABC subunit C [Halorussus gelatinilyticus]|uniref:UvrABC system protein C n=1 Tax=Halorussus gelatinilyticus TaxID=2937524 RepID=A0A8U0ILQ2_9EURY|nr:excinuclease ABC subunit C [Halorussus gelatinilyticus]UPW02060.1 excinuclease ABC subunit C [Halorussus gelatinilyticus]